MLAAAVMMKLIMTIAPTIIINKLMLPNHCSDHSLKSIFILLYNEFLSMFVIFFFDCQTNYIIELGQRVLSSFYK